MTEEKEMKTYIITHEDGTVQRITVPASWKVTFGPAAKGMNAGRGSGPGYKIPLALRFYEADTKQRAIFTDVVSFRDASIKIEEQISRVQEKDGYMECEGVKKRTAFRATVKEWVNPDEVPEKPALLPSDSEMYGAGAKKAADLNFEDIDPQCETIG
jgi:hypothetical protein